MQDGYYSAEGTADKAANVCWYRRIPGRWLFAQRHRTSSRRLVQGGTASSSVHATSWIGAPLLPAHAAAALLKHVMYVRIVRACPAESPRPQSPPRPPAPPQVPLPYAALYTDIGYFFREFESKFGRISNLSALVDDLLSGITTRNTKIMRFQKEQLSVTRVIVDDKEVPPPTSGPLDWDYVRHYPYSGGDVIFFFSVLFDAATFKDRPSTRDLRNRIKATDVNVVPQGESVHGWSLRARYVHPCNAFGLRGVAPTCGWVGMTCQCV